MEPTRVKARGSLGGILKRPHCICVLKGVVLGRGFIKYQSLKYMNELIAFFKIHALRPDINDTLKATFANDFFSYDKHFSNHLVGNGFPLEFSFSFGINARRNLRFAAEPMNHTEIISRTRSVKQRFLKILKINDMENFSFDFEKISNIVVGANDFPCLKWFLHFGFVFSDTQTIIKFYFGVCPPEVFRNRNAGFKNYRQEAEVGVMENIKKCQEIVKQRFINLLSAYGMNEKIGEFKKIYKILLGNDRLQDKRDFITFIGVDFEKNKEPSFKVYFNPNIRE